MAVSEVSAQLKKIGTWKHKPDGTKMKIRIFANLAVKVLSFLTCKTQIFGCSIIAKAHSPLSAYLLKLNNFTRHNIVH